MGIFFSFAPDENPMSSPFIQATLPQKKNKEKQGNLDQRGVTSPRLFILRSCWRLNLGSLVDRLRLPQLASRPARAWPSNTTIGEPQDATEVQATRYGS